MAQPPCPTEDDLLAFVQGLAPAEPSARIRAHLDGCAACAALVAESARQLLSSQPGLEAAAQPPGGEEPAPEPPVPLETGARLGRYSILRLLGRGAMGAVYLADDPELKRRVAIKLLRPDSRFRMRRAELQERLLREAQAMARLQHPNVLPIHDVGRFGDGVFLALEYVEGGTLRRWLDEKPRAASEILAVFRQAGAGLAAAHASGIVHRDFKPENVLLDESGRAYVTDFGVARLVAGEGDEPEGPAGGAGGPRLSVTRTGTVAGTPAYMAPEQLRGQPADARADVFGFCAALYHALWRARPFAGDDLETLRAAVTAGQVRKPPRGPKVPARVRRAVLRGLRPDPAQRFPAMEPLLRELEPPRRPAWLYAAAALALVALGGSFYGTRRLAEERMEGCRRGTGRLEMLFDAARQQAVERAFTASGLAYAAASWQLVREGLQRWLGAWDAARADACAATHRRHEQSDALLDRRIQCLDDRLQDAAALVDALAAGGATTVEKAIQAVHALRSVTACADRQRLLDSVGMPEDRAARERVVAVREKVARLAALDEAGRYREGLEQSEAVVAEAKATGYAPLLAEALLWHGRLQMDGGEQKKALETLAQAAAAAVRARRDDLAATAESALVWVFGREQNAAEMERWAELARAQVARAGDDEVLLAELLSNRGAAWTMAEQPAKALPDHEQALALLEKRLGPGHPKVAQTTYLLARDHGHLSRFADGLRVGRRALELSTRSLGEMHPQTLNALNWVGTMLMMLGRGREALAIIEDVLERRRKVLGEDHRDMARSWGAIGCVLNLLGRYDEAVDAFARSHAVGERRLGARHPELGTNHIVNAESFYRSGRFAEAHAELRIAEECLRNMPGDHSWRGFLIATEARVLEAEERFAEAEAAWRRALEILEKANPESSDTAECLAGLAAAATRRGRPQEAIALYGRTLPLLEKTYGGENVGLWEPLLGLGEALLAARKPAEAREALERAARLLEPTDLAPLYLAHVRFSLARALWDFPAERARALEEARKAEATVNATKYERGSLRRDLAEWLRGRPAAK